MIRTRANFSSIVCRAVGVLAVLIGVAACGSGASSTGAHTRSSSTGTTAQGNGIAQKPPAQILAAAQSALSSVKGYELSGTLTDKGQSEQIRIVQDNSGNLHISASSGGKTDEIIALPKADYVRANSAYWRAETGPASAKVLAGRWIKVPAKQSAALTRGIAQFQPKRMARCLREDVGTLSRGGRTTVNGRSAVQIRDAGNVPGGTPGTLSIATTGPPYPLRTTVTGPTRAGGKVDVCNNGKASAVEGTLNLSHFGDPPAVTAPAHATTLSSLTGTSQTD